MSGFSGYFRPGSVFGVDKGKVPAAVSGGGKQMTSMTQKLQAGLPGLIAVAVLAGFAVYQGFPAVRIACKSASAGWVIQIYRTELVQCMPLEVKQEIAAGALVLVDSAPTCRTQ
jgi:hypothetical protein